MTGFVLIGKHIKECLTIFSAIILTQIVTMKFIQRNKKSALLVFEGYGYIRHRQLTDGASSRLCCIAKCNGRVRRRNEELEVITVHSHLPDPAYIEKKKVRSALKDRAAMSDETPAKQYLLPRTTSTEKEHPVFQITTQTKGQLTERANKIVRK